MQSPEVTFQNRKGYTATVHRSPSENNLQFQCLLLGFEKQLDDLVKLRLYFTTIFADFHGGPIPEQENWAHACVMCLPRT